MGGDVPTLNPPFLLKPCNEDNSQGISLVRPGNDVQQALDLAFSFDSEVLCEEYVPLGRELRVAGLEMEDGSLKVLPCIEYFLTENDPIRTARTNLSPTRRVFRQLLLLEAESAQQISMTCFSENWKTW